MKFNNRMYPHPVLGNFDDISGEFSCSLTVESDAKNILLKPIIHIQNDTLENYLKEGRVYVCAHLYCRGTLFRENYLIKDLISEEIKIDAANLNGDTEVDFLICSNEDIIGYQNFSANSEYGENKFFIEKGDVLAYGGKGIFFANKTPESLKAISSIMRIKKGSKKNGPFKVEYDNKFIIIILSETDYEIYSDIKLNPKYVNILHASVVLPALLEAIYFISSNEGGEQFENSEWYKVLNEKIEKVKGDSILEKLQIILELPINREFLSMENLIEYE